jgi:ABC-2 type transport system ATP-binding protein
MSTAVEVEGLIKRFGSVVALDGLDLRVVAGEVHGFLGPNGAGKSTTLRVLLGLLRADGGRVEVLGSDPWHDATALHRRLAYVPGDVVLWPTLTGGETIDVLGRFRGGFSGQRRDALVDRFELDPTRRARTYSKGNRQKVALVAALASDAELLILDEPTSGLDPLMERVFAECIAEERAQGRAVLLSSHALSEVEQLCDRISIIRAGRLVESGRLTDLRQLHRSRVHAQLVAVPPRLGDLDGVAEVAVTGTTLHCSVEPAALDRLMAVLAASGILSLEVTPPSLEELFFNLYRDSPASAALAP